jgi:formylglycine-generating enzyme required for sulfatase activity
MRSISSGDAGRSSRPFVAWLVCYCRGGLGRNGAMGSLAELDNLVGFFSYAREDDEDFRGELSAIRGAIGRNLAALLGKTKGRNFRLWQDVDAIAPGKLWKAEIDNAIEESAFFIPIVTPRAVQSPYCRNEFEAFLAREQALGRNDLVFPILFIPVPALKHATRTRNDRVLAIIAERQFVDWTSFGYEDISSPASRLQIRRLCEPIAERLHEPWLSPEERAQIAKQRAEEERVRREAKAEEEARLGEGAEPDAPTFLAPSPPAAFLTPSNGVLEPAPRTRERRSLASVAPLTAAQERALKPGDSFKEGGECPEMIVVRAGRFLMGSREGEGDGNEHPQHEVIIAKPFAVAKFAVTFDEWDACAASGGCRRDVSDQQWGRRRRPAINVSWDDARAYIKWLSSITGKPYRLLSEAEWEYAARAGSETKYPWGDNFQPNGKAMANARDSGSEWGGKQTAPVGSFPANAFGLHDMVGNVWEWVEDCWNGSYRGAPGDGSPWTSGDCSRRVVRGSSWFNYPGNLRSADRYGDYAGNRITVLGFRVARTLSAGSDAITVATGVR